MALQQKIIVIGGTGYAGSAIAAEAAKRGHQVISVSRSAPTIPIAQVNYVTANVAELEDLLQGADVVVAALSPRGRNVGALSTIYAQLTQQVADVGARLILVGGYSCLRRAAGEPRILEKEGFPEGTPAEIIVEAQENLDVLHHLLNDQTGVDWLFVSPALVFSAWTPGEDLGHYRIGNDVALYDEHGRSAISGIDYARGILDEIETPVHHRMQVGLAY